MLFEHSPELGELFTALAKAQAEMDAAVKSSDNPFYKSHYSDLAEVIKTGKVLHKHGLSVTQHPYGEHDLLTILGHQSGQYIISQMSRRPIKDDPQGHGSVLTYMRRYAYQAVTGMASADDDGNAACAVTTYNGSANHKSVLWEMLKVRSKGADVSQEDARTLSEKCMGKPITEIGKVVDKFLKERKS